MVIPAEVPSYSEVERITTGASVSVTGVVVESPGGGQRLEVKAEEVKPGFHACIRGFSLYFRRSPRAAARYVRRFVVEGDLVFIAYFVVVARCYAATYECRSSFPVERAGLRTSLHQEDVEERVRA